MTTSITTTNLQQVILQQVINEKEENGLRLHLLLEKCSEALQNLFHQTFSYGPTTLYLELIAYKPKLKFLKKQGILTQTQWNLMFPQNKQTISKHFDITLTILLLREFCNILAPQTGWLKDPKPSDNSLGSQLVRLRNARNYLKHNTIAVDNKIFKKYWNILSVILHTIGVSQNEIDTILKCALDQDIVRKLHKTQSDLVASQSTISHLQNCLTSVWWNVAQNVTNYTTRDEDLLVLHDLMIQSESKTYGVVVSGLGGVGKTELTKHYCHTYGNSHYDDNVVWLNADGINALGSSFFEFATYLEISVKDTFGKAINIETIVAKVFRFFANRKSLFVYDNVISSVDIQSFLPISIPLNGIKPKIIITSQHTNWTDQNFTTQSLDTFTKEASQRFVQESLKQKTINEEEILEIVRFCGCLPLALQQAVAYIRKTGISAGKYISLLSKYSTEILYAESKMSPQNTVLKTWKIALDQLHKPENKEALNLINMMAFLNGKNIIKDLFLSIIPSEIKLNEYIAVLSAYSLVTISENNDDVVLKIHSLVQLVIRETAPQQTADVTLDLLQTHIDVKILNKFTFGDSWVDHMIKLFTDSNFDDKLAKRFFEFIKFIKQAMMNKGKYTVCAEFFQSMLAKITDLKDIQLNLPISDLREDIAKLVQFSGRYEEAHEMFLQLLIEEESKHAETIGEILSKRVLTEGKGKRNFRILVVRKYAVARSNMYQGNYKECLQILNEIQNLIKIVWDDNHPFWNTVEHGRGLCLLNSGKFRKALKIFKDVAFYGYENYSTIKLNEDNDFLRQEGMLPEIWVAKSCMAKCLLGLNKPKKALQLFKEVDNERLKRLGELHLTTLQDKCNTARCIAQYFDFTKGMQMLQEIEQKQISILEDENHPHIFQTKYNIAKSYEKRKRKREALNLYLRLYEIQMRVLGDEHTKTRKTYQRILECKEHKQQRCCVKRTRYLESGITDPWQPQPQSLFAF